MSLVQMHAGQSGTISFLDLAEEVSDHLAHLGFMPGAGVEVLRKAPAGDPTVYRIDGVEVALRRDLACHIHVEIGA